MSKTLPSTLTLKFQKVLRTTVTLAVLLLIVTTDVRSQAKPLTDLQPTVILISLDGFRSDYLTLYRPHNLMSLAAEGVRARWMIPSFPSKTFPNHYTIATGLYPQDHGIVENNIYDPPYKEIFTLSDRKQVENSRWWLGEPIWVTAEKQNQRTASIFYPGTEGEIAGVRPTFWKKYDEKMSNDARVDAILSWFDLPRGERPTFFALYFSDTDDAGHEFGPVSKQTKAAVARLDQAIGRLVEGLKARRIFKQVNMIVVSDHGMAPVRLSNAILLDKLFDTSLTERIFWTRELVSIFPKPGNENQVYETLKRRLPPQAHIYRKTEMPPRFHYSRSPRIAPLLVVPREGWILTDSKTFANLQAMGETERVKGGHGYDNRLPSMRAIFIAHGEAFKKAKVVGPFENVEVYNIMTRILGLKPAPNDGDYAAAKAVLK
jgi:predicted AlkP superfamily pyrophosphatase or phosphodiesterase